MSWNLNLLTVTRWEITTSRVRAKGWIRPEKWSAIAGGYDDNGERQVIIGRFFDQFRASTRQGAEEKIEAEIDNYVAKAKQDRDFKQTEIKTKETNHDS